MRQEREVTIRPYHFDLLREANWRWDDGEYGAPSIDCKRPFGNSGRYTISQEIAKICGFEIPPDEDNDNYSEIEWEIFCDQMYTVWEECLYALEIALKFKEFKPGIYRLVETNYYQTTWKKVTI